MARPFGLAPGSRRALYEQPQGIPQTYIQQYITNHITNTTTLHNGLRPGPEPKPAGWPLPRLFRGGQAPGGVEAKTSDLSAPLFPGPLSPLGVEGFDGGPRRSGYIPLQGQRASAAPYTWRDRAKPPCGRPPREGSPTGPMAGPLVLTAFAQPIPVGADSASSTRPKGSAQLRCTEGKARGPLTMGRDRTWRSWKPRFLH